MVKVEESPGPRSSLNPSLWFIRWRKVGVCILLALPTLGHVIGDFARRGHRLLAMDALHRFLYLAAVLESLLVSGFLIYAAARRRGVMRWVAAVLLVLLTTFAFGGQSYFFEQYRVYLNADVSSFASNLMDSVVNQVFADWKNYAKATAPAMVGAILVVWLAHRFLRPTRGKSRLAGILAPLLVVVAFFIPTQHRQVQASTPDVLYLHAIGGLLETELGLSEQAKQVRPRTRSSLPLSPLVARPQRPRNVLFLQLESVRFDATCNTFDPECRRTEATNQLLPGRYALEQMHSLDSSTAISLAVLWSGLPPTAPREELHTFPLLFDYARAAHYHTAYFTSQNLMFGNSRLWVKNLGVERMFSATDLDPAADLDIGATEELLATRVNQELDTFPEPFFLAVQLSNTHFPYYVDPKGPQPFQPQTLSKAPEDNAHFYNYYKNSVYQQDRYIAAILKHLRSLPIGERTVVVYTSDHGEAFREHGNMGHTSSVLEEEIHVPGWIDAPEGTLAPEEETALMAKRNLTTTHVDLFATMLDLFGVWDAPEIARFRSRIVGQSLLRDDFREVMLPLTNCAGVWSCAFENWGILEGKRKIEAREWDYHWHCWDLVTDPQEKHDLGEASCPDLVKAAKETFGRLPGRDRH